MQSTKTSTVILYVAICFGLFLILSLFVNCASRSEHTFHDYSSEAECVEGFICSDEHPVDCYDPEKYFYNDEFMVCPISPVNSAT